MFWPNTEPFRVWWCSAATSLGHLKDTYSTLSPLIVCPIYHQTGLGLPPDHIQESPHLWLLSGNITVRQRDHTEDDKTKMIKILTFCWHKERLLLKRDFQKWRLKLTMKLEFVVAVYVRLKQVWTLGRGGKQLHCSTPTPVNEMNHCFCRFNTDDSSAEGDSIGMDKTKGPERVLTDCCQRLKGDSN